MPRLDKVQVGTWPWVETRYPVTRIMQAKYLATPSKPVPLLIAQPACLSLECVRTMTALLFSGGHFQHHQELSRAHIASIEAVISLPFLDTSSESILSQQLTALSAFFSPLTPEPNKQDGEPSRYRCWLRTFQLV